MLDSTYPNKLCNECRILWESVSFGCGTTPCQVTGGWTAIILVLLVQCLLMVQAFHQRIRPIAFQACYSIPSIRSEIQKKMGSLKSKRNQPPNQSTPCDGWPPHLVPCQLTQCSATTHQMQLPEKWDRISGESATSATDRTFAASLFARFD